MTVEEAVSAVAELVSLGPPAPAPQIAAAERRIGVQMPADLVAFYMRANGTVDHTPVDKGWTRLWMTDEWRPVKTLECGPIYAEIDDAAVIADYSLESWYYAVDRQGGVYIVDGLRPPRVVAEGFLEFVKMLVKDEKGLYPRSEEAG